MQCKMEKGLLEKLYLLSDDEKCWESWSLEEKKKLLDIYWVFCTQEANIFRLIYQNHGCDSWEDIFRDYDKRYLGDKATGVQLAIETIAGEIWEEKNKKEKQQM
jgi:hypothetical protein